MSIFCTISTTSHLFKTYALANSLSAFGFKLHILVVDGGKLNDSVLSNIVHYSLSDVTDEVGLKLIKKYQSNKDKLRWGLKSVFFKQLLNQNEKVIYVDNDTYFYADPQFLFDELDTHHVLLTPHFYRSNPAKDQNWLEANYRVGLFNAGFIGASKKAVEALEWWADCCLYKITKSTSRGLFDDQKYLDLFPVKFEGVRIIKHKGCNLAGWNYEDYQIEASDKHEVLINGKYPLVFIHFAESSMLEFSKPTSPLHTCFNTYMETLRTFNNKYIFKRNYFSWYIIINYFNFLLWKLKRMID